MDGETINRVEKLFHLASARPPTQRQAFPETACANDRTLRREIESLLAADEGARTTFLPSRR